MSRLSNNSQRCKLDGVYVPHVNYVNDQEHIYYDE